MSYHSRLPSHLADPPCRYGIYAGSALATITCWRYLASGAVNLFSRPMYEGIGVHWSCTWLGCLAVLQSQLPFLFYRYGPLVRKKSSFAGRWSAKEAVFKSLGVQGKGAGAPLKDIEILPNETGAPIVTVSRLLDSHRYQYAN